MTYNFASLLGYQRNRKGTGLAQGINDELFSVIRVRRIQERRHGYGLDGRNICRRFLAYYWIHRTTSLTGWNRCHPIQSAPIRPSLDCFVCFV